MTSGVNDLALEHLERVNQELKRELEKVEQKLADLESDGVVKRSRVEELAEALAALNREWEARSAAAHADGPEAMPEEIRLARETITGLLDDKRLDAGLNEKLTDAYSGFRSRLMDTANALELVIAALRKRRETRQRVPTAVRAMADAAPTGPRAPLGSSAIIRSQELERQRIAREIHDGPAQAIANVVLRMDILSKVCEKDTTRIPTELARMKEIAQGALDEIRGFIFDLRPMTLQDLGLVATIKRVVQSMREMAGLNVRFVVDGDERPLGQLVNLAVFRIAQEALNNIRKYADCRTAWVHLKYLDHKVILIVEDDGAGFDVNEVANSQKKYATYGLLGMQERADDIGATLEVSSAPRDGTKVVLVVPTDHNPAIDTELDEEAHKSENEQ